MSDWRPIETAPKTGEPIIGLYWYPRDHRNYGSRKGRVVLCWYQPEFDEFISSCREMTLAPGLKFDDGTDRQLHSPEIERPSHWLPFAPLSQENEG